MSRTRVVVSDAAAAASCDAVEMLTTGDDGKGDGAGRRVKERTDGSRVRVMMRLCGSSSGISSSSSSPANAGATRAVAAGPIPSPAVSLRNVVVVVLASASPCAATQRTASSHGYGRHGPHCVVRDASAEAGVPPPPPAPPPPAPPAPAPPAPPPAPPASPLLAYPQTGGAPGPAKNCITFRCRSAWKLERAPAPASAL
ncbi:hypothetical protein DFH08DRAFT_858075 [Mycena albidolilacea]|uniref:Uncharacterized protein n=1 Tax=Mycena albidolilacea TaxID=1033008 RepID=A0AAD7A8H9_9AGAR|nr:hypothetical protein DFH08DRAFT_858075 [Mycena albidolilacea]